ncbi:hypothetical protein BDA99DRAFT_496065 [Phascolomyces articulosus]|uniref:YitH/HolE acetyltransferase (GNAT) domain-containing protein n=1 Tax=Phascolomyces articulosus TaxID=60185 RepID=A0AAD5PJ30_9FUNG|nr:hypothetical protein BDA99DRAFT_496065 [Phascolomyces articulosus]
MTQTSFQVRQCVNVKEAVAAHYAWAITEQWDAGKDGNDIKLAFYPTHSAGFLIGIVTEEEDREEGKVTNEKAVSCICGMKYDDGTGFLALYIVGDASQRNKGYGIRVFNQSLEDLSSSRWIGLNAVEEQVSNYQKSGFILRGSITRFNGRKKKEDNNRAITGASAIDIDRSHLFVEKLIDRDHRSSGLYRPTFIKNWINYHESHGWALALMHCQPGAEEKKVVGFGCMRPLASGAYRIGPLYADTLDYAVDLVTQLMGKVPDDAEFTTDSFMATPEINELFQNKLGWSPVATFYQMWRKGADHSNEEDHESHPPPFEAPMTKDGYYSVFSLEVG